MDEPVIGCIGLGRMGLGNLNGVIRLDEAQVVAVCDVDSKRIAFAQKRINDYYAEKRNIPAIARNSLRPGRCTSPPSRIGLPE